ncbi:MAG: hypothetical protein ACXWJX_03710 [Limisphaerales bacterium]
MDANGTNAIPPFVDWSTAATNIQDAIDAGASGDLVLVTNGVYASGGRAMDGVLTNRVSLNKAITVQSVNGPLVTTIQGTGPTNGPNAVRCAWITNNAALVGFTLKWGATRTSGTEATEGGAVFGTSSNLAMLASCIVVSNNGSMWAAAYQASLSSCYVATNIGYAAYKCMLKNCTVVTNSSGIGLTQATNCIIYYNSGLNISGSTLGYCCLPSLPGSGTGNFTNAPQLFADGIHLMPGSPCLGAGGNIATGTDLFGTAWANPPAVGCAELSPAPVMTRPQLVLSSDPVGFKITATVTGQLPITLGWLKDGVALMNDGHFTATQTTNLVVLGIGLNDAGVYQLVASNASRVVTSDAALVVAHYVDSSSTNALAPYLSWDTAATNIQDAIASANAAELVLVTNGVYGSGGKSVDGVITNRVVVDKGIIVHGVNGPNFTIIQGTQDPATNGPLAVRCAWLTNTAVLSGFTLTGGATRASGSAGTSVHGGGVWANSNSATVFNCNVVSNSAGILGGGAYQVKLLSSLLRGNTATTGGGASTAKLRQCLVTGNFSLGSGGGSDTCNLTNCAIVGNSATSDGGATHSAILVNCTVANNFSRGSGVQSPAAVSGATLINCIVYGNTANGSSNPNYASCAFSYSDTTPLAGGTGNIAIDPKLLGDGIHLLEGSPCIGKGANSVVFGSDIDGRPWANPPSMGCSEWDPRPIIVPQLSVQAISPGHVMISVPAAGLQLTCYWFQNGLPISDGNFFGNSAATNLMLNLAPECAGTYQVIVSNAYAMATSGVAQVVVRCVDVNNTSPISPYTTWSNAANNIQDAIDATNPGDFVLVTNGVYASGGRSVDAILTNRITIDKPIVVMSVNGYRATVIQGMWDPVASTNWPFVGNGPLAVRCAWLTNRSILMGFSVQGGATRATGATTAQSGGGVYCNSSDALVSHCVVTNNTAGTGAGVANGTIANSLVTWNIAGNYSGGGAYQSTLRNCTVINNYSTWPSFAAGVGAGVYNCLVFNCIVTGNTDGYPVYGFGNDNYAGAQQMTYCCTTPLPAGTSNINSATFPPIFVDYFHLSSNSSCRGAGSFAYTSETDMDGEFWTNPPSIGCDEVLDGNLVGSLSVNIETPLGTNGVVTKVLLFNGMASGHASRVSWVFDGGPVLTNSNWYYYKSWPSPGTYNANFTAYNASNPDGVSTNVTVVIAPINQPLMQSTVTGTNLQFTFATQRFLLYSLQVATNLASPISWKQLSSPQIFGTGDVEQLGTTISESPSNQFYRIMAQ